MILNDIIGAFYSQTNRIEFLIFLKSHLRSVGTAPVEDTPQILKELEDIAVQILAPSQIYLTVKVVVMGLEVELHKDAPIQQGPVAIE